MKTLLKFVFVLAIVTLCGNVSAQKPLKLAHLNVDELVQSMPDYDTAMRKMQKLSKDLQTEMESMQVEYNKKFEDYNTNAKNLTDLVRQSREQELVAMQQKMQVFRESAQEQMDQEQAKLLQPIIEKINKAVEVVAKEQGITYVLSANQQILLYKSLDSQDIMPLVQQQLGVKKK